MKHFRICFITFIFIVAGAVSSCIYIKSEITQLSLSLKKYNSIQYISENDINTVRTIKNRLINKKNMLQFFINKEHIHQLETNILLLENSVLNKDAESCREKSIEAMVVLDRINEYITAID